MASPFMLPQLSGNPGLHIKREQLSPHPAAMLDRARRWVLDLFNSHAQTHLVWHHFGQINSLVAQCAVLALEDEASEQDLAALYCAAWFSYSGWLFDLEKPLEASIRLAQQFLDAEKASFALKEEVKSLLPLTDLASHPTSLSGNLLWDASIALHYGNDYADSQRLRRQEASALAGKELTGQAWRSQEWHRLRNLQCYTAVGKATIEPLLQRVRMELEKRIARDQTPEKDPQEKPSITSSNSAIQTYFKTSYHNHVHLSGIADRKAQMLLSVNAILISVLITVLSYSNLAETSPPLLIPISWFMLFGLGSLVFAVLSAKPKVTREPIANLSPNERQQKLLFFGHFTQIDADAYVDEMTSLIQDTPILYKSMHRDMYFLGKVLDRKFRLVSLAYNLFLAGFIGAVASFLLVHFLWL